MRSEVQVLLDPPLSPERGVSSAGRAPALQAGGHRFDPDTLHQADPRLDRRAASAVPPSNRTQFDIVQRYTSVSRRSSRVRDGQPVRPAKRDTIQVKYTNPKPLFGAEFARTNQPGGRDSMLLISAGGASKGPSASESGTVRSPSLSGSDQAREGRLVDALAARGDEGRDTLR